MTREIRTRYIDPTDLIWLRTAERLDMGVRRSDDVFASWDPATRDLTISTPDGLDPDDCLAQMIFHEICHALVEAPAGLDRRDWGLENVDDRDLTREHACHRLQAKLADRHGLRGFMAVTTDWRPYWDALPEDPLGPGSDPATALAREAWERSRREPWRSALDDALAATAAIAAIAAPFGGGDTLWDRTTALHSTGFPGGDLGTCGTCAWGFVGGRGKAVLRCRQTRVAQGGDGTRVAAHEPGCARWEPELGPGACDPCGACCREGFHIAPVGAAEPLAKAHPELLVREGRRLHLPRPSGRCVALTGGSETPFRCQVYALRPRACSDLAIGSDACLEARRRCGVSGDKLREPQW